MGFLDKHRIIPRAMASVFLWMSVDVWFWFRSIPQPENVHSLALTGVLAVTAGFCKFYMETGAKHA